MKGDFDPRGQLRERGANKDIDQKMSQIHCPSLLGAYYVSSFLWWENNLLGWFSVFIVEASPHSFFLGSVFINCYKLKAM